MTVLHSAPKFASSEGVKDALSAALANEATTHLPRKPRMADFAVWVSAAESATPWPPGGFMDAYE